MASLTVSLPSAIAPSVRRERPLAVALVGSGVVHAVLAIAITVRLITLPAPQPPSATSTDLRAVLQYAPLSAPAPLPEPLDRIAAPTLAPLLVPLLPPEPSARAETNAAPTPLPAPAPAPGTTATLQPRVLDPNGSVTVGVLTDAQQVSRGIVADVAERYRTRVDRAPRLTASLIVLYPSAARRARTGARITAVLDLDESGRITRSNVVPHDPTFEPAVIEALKEAQFTPAEVATHPVPYWAVLEFDFAIAPAARAR